jgi:DNA invertase Pin-like site-specific DNA recombinase
MQTAVIYARYSSDSQTEQSIDGQLRVCEEYAKNHGILLLDTYIDRAMTGTNDNRPYFQRMIKDSNRKEWNYVLVYKLDRFSRNKYKTAIHKKTLRDNDVKVLSAMENIPDTPEGIILESLLEGMNQYYSAELSQKVKRGMRETRLKGLYQGGGLPYGYKVVERKVVIDETKAETVRFMYDCYSKGVTVKAMIAELTAKGILYKGKPFAPNTVYGILGNEKYSGAYTKGDEIIDNIYPQLISTDTYSKVRANVEKNKFGKRSIKAVYLLRHKVKCGYCGRPISAETGTARNGEVKRYYKCIGRKKDNNGCIKTQIPKDFLEEFVTNAIVQSMTETQSLDIIVAEIMRRQSKEENGNLKMLANEKTRIDRALENLVTAIENGITSTPQISVCTTLKNSKSN